MAGWTVHQTPGHQQGATGWDPAALAHQHQHQPLQQQQPPGSNKRRSLHADPDESAHALKRLRIANPLTDPTFASGGAPSALPGVLTPAWPPDPAAGVGLHLAHSQPGSHHAAPGYHMQHEEQQQHYRQQQQQQQQQLASASRVDPSSASPKAIPHPRPTTTCRCLSTHTLNHHRELPLIRSPTWAPDRARRSVLRHEQHAGAAARGAHRSGGASLVGRAGRRRRGESVAFERVVILHSMNSVGMFLRCTQITLCA